MRWAFLLIHDGREDYRDRTLESAKIHLPEPDEFIEIDDSAHELGFGGAIQAGWSEATKRAVDFLFHCEGDFLFNEPVPIGRMARVLHDNPYLAQISLLRQPWNEEEAAAGGVLHRHGIDNFLQRMQHGDVWVEHRVFFTTNPCLLPIGLCHQGWPQVERSEGVFTHRLIESPETAFGIWGSKVDSPKVHHIGEFRAGHGY